MNKLIISPKQIDNGERFSYDRFRIEHPEIEMEGLYKAGHWYYIYCPSVMDVNYLNQINNSFQQIIPIGSHIVVANTLPENPHKIEERSLSEINNLVGAARVKFDHLNDIHLEIKKVIRNYKIDNRRSHIIIYTTDTVSEEIAEQLQTVSNRIGVKLIIENVENFDNLSDEENPGEPFLGGLVISRFNSQSFSGRVKNTWEEDEDFWIDTRSKLFSEAVHKEDFKPLQWKHKKSKCFVNCTTSSFPCKLINLLTLYDQIYIVSPVKHYYKDFIHSLGISLKELIELTSLGRIKFIFPQNLNRYDTEMLESICDIQDSFLMTRRLATISVADLRHRNPLLFPNLSIQERQRGILDLRSVIGKATKEESFLVDLLANGIKERWFMYPELIHSLGAIGVNHFGISRSISKVLEFDDDATLLMDIASQSVEWSGALDAHLIPFQMGKISIEPYARIIANIYSGVPEKNWVPTNFGYANLATGRILAVDSDIPVLEFANTFKSPDINLFREFIYDLVYHKKSPEELEAAIKEFNFHVEEYEKTKKAVTDLDITGFVVDLATNRLNMVLSSWVVERLINLFEKYSGKTSTLQKLIDNIESIKTFASPPSSILLSRMRNNLSDTWRKYKYK